MSGSVGGFLVRVAAAGGFCAVVAAMLLATPAMADNADDVLLQLSRDGVHYTSETVSNIFEQSSGMVPGGSRQGSVWVRNASDEAASFSLAVKNTGTSLSPILPEFLGFAAASQDRTASVNSLPDPGDCSVLIDGWTLSGDESLHLTMNLNLALAAPNATRNQESTFELMFVLQGIDGGSSVSACDAPEALPGDVSLGSTPLMTGTTALRDETMSGGSDPNNDLSAASIGTADGAPAVLLGMPDAVTEDSEEAGDSGVTHRGKLRALAASNVESNSRTPWPWLLVLSAATYMAISMRRRRQHNEPAGTFHPSE